MQNEILINYYSGSIVIDIVHRKIIIDTIPYSFTDVIDFTFRDNSYVEKTAVSATTKTDNGNAIGRALVGGMLFGGVGAAVGGMTAATETTFDLGKETTIARYAVEVTMNDFHAPLIHLNFGNDISSVRLFCAYLKIILYKNSSINNRYGIYQKLHDIRTYYDEGLMTSEEYEREVDYIKLNDVNPIKEDTERIKTEIEEARRIKEYEEKKTKIEYYLSCGNKEDAESEGLLSERKILKGYQIDSLVTIKETGESAVITGITTDDLFVCKANDKYLYLKYGDFL